MSLRTEILPVFDRLRALTGPKGLDIRVAQLTVRKRVWSGGRRGAGTPMDTDTVLPKIYKLRHVSAHEVSSSGGRFEAETVCVGPITPAYPGGGYSKEVLAPDGYDGIEIIYVISGSVSGDYKLAQIHTEKPFGYFLFLNRLRTTP